MNKYVSILSIVLLLLVGCKEEMITGEVTAELEPKTIMNGETATFTVNLKNTGKIAANVFLEIIPEDKSKLQVIYPGELEQPLQSGEEMTKIIRLRGFTDYTSTKYWVKVRLVEKVSGTVLDEEEHIVTVRKQ